MTEKTMTEVPQELYQLPPNEVEDALIGCLLAEPSLLEEVQPTLDSEDFIHFGDRQIYVAMERLAADGHAIDPTAVIGTLEEMGELRRAGGAKRVHELHNAQEGPECPTRGLTYAALVGRRGKLKRFQRALERATDGIASSHDIAEALSHLDGVMDEVATLGQSQGPQPVYGMLGPLLDEIEQRQDKPTGLRTGLHDFDRITGGLHAPDQIIVAARPACGKTSWALSVVHHVCLEEGSRAVVFSLEMNATQVLERLLAMEASVDSSHIRDGRLDGEEWARLSQAAARWSEADLLIDDSEPLTITDIRAKARRLHREKPLHLIVVDYIQLVSAGSSADGLRSQEVARVSRELKAMARELEVPVIALAQINRGIDHRTDHQPVMADLSESGAIEANADIIAFLHKESMYDPSYDNPNEVQLILKKHRNGELGTVPLFFNSSTTRFLPLARHVWPVPNNQDEDDVFNIA